MTEVSGIDLFSKIPGDFLSYFQRFGGETLIQLY